MPAFARSRAECLRSFISCSFAGNLRSRSSCRDRADRARSHRARHHRACPDSGCPDCACRDGAFPDSAFPDSAFQDSAFQDGARRSAGARPPHRISCYGCRLALSRRNAYPSARPPRHRWHRGPRRHRPSGSRCAGYRRSRTSAREPALSARPARAPARGRRARRARGERGVTHAGAASIAPATPTGVERFPFDVARTRRLIDAARAARHPTRGAAINERCRAGGSSGVSRQDAPEDPPGERLAGTSTRETRPLSDQRTEM
jgi:hypothetical protein